jgi:hypothetical protein
MEGNVEGVDPRDVFPLLRYSISAADMFRKYKRTVVYKCRLGVEQRHGKKIRKCMLLTVLGSRPDQWYDL